jgi:hypothetical protein
MHNAIPLILAAFTAVAIIVIGCFYLVSPERISGTFGLRPPASDADTRAWLRPKGIRDIASGLVVLTLMLTADRRLVGIAVLVYAIIPFGDMSIVLGSGGSKSRAFSIHGVTCAVMLVVGLLLIPCHLRGMSLTDLWRVKDGKLIEHWDEFDLLEVFHHIAAAADRKAEGQ